VLREILEQLEKLDHRVLRAPLDPHLVLVKLGLKETQELRET